MYLRLRWSNVQLRKWTFAVLCSVQECLLINPEMRWCRCDLERKGRWTGSEWRVGVSLVHGVSVPWLDPHSSTAPSYCFCWRHPHPQQWTSNLQLTDTVCTQVTTALYTILVLLQLSILQDYFINWPSG